MQVRLSIYIYEQVREPKELQRAQNTLNQNHNTIQNRNIVSGTVTPLDGETLVDVTTVHFTDGSLDEYGNFNYFQLM